MTTPHPLILDWRPEEIAHELDLRRIEKHFGLSLPAWYKQFMLAHGAGTAETKDRYVILYPAASLIEANSGHGVGLDMMDYGLFIFGTDGGGCAYAFHVRRQPYDIVDLAFICSYREDGRILGSDLKDLLSYSDEGQYPTFEPIYVIERDDDRQG